MAKSAPKLQPTLPARASGADVLPATGLFERDPVDALEATEWIRARIEAGRRSALEIAVLIAHVRDHYYREDPSGWLTWAQGEFGYGRRFCFQCLACGHLLAKVRHAALLGCDVEKIDELARIPDDQLRALLEHWDPSKATREEVRRKAKLWTDRTAECDQCGASFEPQGDETTCPQCAGAKAKRPRRVERPTSHLERNIEVLAGMDDPTAKLVADQVGAGIAFRAAFKLLDVALYHVHAYGDMTPELLATWRKDLDTVSTGFDQLAREIEATKPLEPKDP